MTCFDDIASRAEQFLRTLVQRHFGQYSQLARYIK